MDLSQFQPYYFIILQENILALCPDYLHASSGSYHDKNSYLITNMNDRKALTELKPEIRKKSKITQMKFYIYEQKFLELLEDGDCIGAFHCLRYFFYTQ